MSEAQSALPGARFDGLVSVADAGLCGMIALRGDLASAPVARALETVLGLSVPGQKRLTAKADMGALWMSPDELLLLCPHAAAPGIVDKLSAALQGQHALVANLSDARARFVVSGTAVRDVIAKLAPVDLHPDSFGVGQVRRTRFAQVAAAFWLSDDQTAHVICFRSVAEYMFALLCNAADPDSAPGLYAAPN